MIDSENHVGEEARRHFLRASVGITAGLALLAAGALDKLFRFFFGPRLSMAEESEVMKTRLERLQATIEQRTLELERQQSEYILVASMPELSADTGKYFIDYQMNPALAFLGDDGLPNLLSAKCTHLGCTVGNQVDNQRKILCPCHISYFDVKTGRPDPNAPAKRPLPHIGWDLMDAKGELLASRTASGHTTGSVTGKQLEAARVYIVKPQHEATR